MKQNAAKWDRILRGIVGLVLLAVAVIYYPMYGLIAIVAGILGVVMLFVALTGFCPIYKLIGFQTLKKESKSKK